MPDTIIIGESDSNFAHEVANHLGNGDFQVLLLFNSDEVIDRICQ